MQTPIRLALFLLVIGAPALGAQTLDSLRFLPGRIYGDVHWWSRKSVFTTGLRAEYGFGRYSQYVPGQTSVAASLENNRDVNVVTLTLGTHIGYKRWDPFIGLGVQAAVYDPDNEVDTFTSIVDIGLRYHFNRRLSAVVMGGGAFKSLTIGFGRPF
jgi:hypothetical protein